MGNNAFAKTVLKVPFTMPDDANPRNGRMLNVVITHDGITHPDNLSALALKTVNAYRLICRTVGQQLSVTGFEALPAMSALQRYNDELEDTNAPIVPADGYTRITVWAFDIPLTMTDETNLITGAEALYIGMKVLEAQNAGEYNNVLNIITQRPNAPKTPPPPAPDDSVTPDTPTRGIIPNNDDVLNNRPKPKSPFSKPAQKSDDEPNPFADLPTGNTDAPHNTPAPDVFVMTGTLEMGVLYVPRNKKQHPIDVAPTAYNFNDTEWMVNQREYAFPVGMIKRNQHGVLVGFADNMGLFQLFTPKENAQYPDKTYELADGLLVASGEERLSVNDLWLVIKRKDKWVNAVNFYRAPQEEQAGDNNEPF